MTVTVKFIRADGQEDKILEILEIPNGEPVVAVDDQRYTGLSTRIALMVGEETTFHLYGNKGFLFKEVDAHSEVAPGIDAKKKRLTMTFDELLQVMDCDHALHDSDIALLQVAYDVLADDSPKAAGDQDPKVSQDGEVETLGSDDPPKEVER